MSMGSQTPPWRNARFSYRPAEMFKVLQERRPDSSRLFTSATLFSKRPQFIELRSTTCAAHFVHDGFQMFEHGDHPQGAVRGAPHACDKTVRVKLLTGVKFVVPC